MQDTQKKSVCATRRRQSRRRETPDVRMVAGIAEKQLRRRNVAGAGKGWVASDPVFMDMSKRKVVWSDNAPAMRFAADPRATRGIRRRLVLNGDSHGKLQRQLPYFPIMMSRKER